MRLVLVCLLLLLAGCAHTPTPLTNYLPGQTKLTQIALSDRQWTGVAVAADGTIFVNYPRWSDDVPISVASLDQAGQPIPFPDAQWNQWSPGQDPTTHWVCVQSVVVDAKNRLWVLDPGSPQMSGVIPGGAKLVCFDPKTRTMLKRYLFDSIVARPESYFNDVRVDTVRNFAYITDSGLGAIIALDLTTGSAHRLLGTDLSTKSESTPIIIDGQQWLRNGQQPSINSDGIALSHDGQLLYYHALTGRTLYRITTQALRDPTMSALALPSYVQKVDTDFPVDGMEIDGQDRIYLTDLEHHAITRVTFRATPTRLTTTHERLVEDPQLQWPDSLAWGPDGKLYVTTSRIHLAGHPGHYQLFRLDAVAK